MIDIELFFKNYISTKYDIDLSVMKDFTCNEEVELNDMDLFHVVKMLNSLPEYWKELCDNSIECKQLADNQKLMEHMSNNLRSNKSINKLKRQELQEEFKKVLDLINNKKSEILLLYVGSKFNVADGHINTKQDNQELYIPTSLVTSNGKEYPYDKYCEKIFKYQYEFYKLSANINNETLAIYELMATSNYFQADVHKTLSNSKQFEFNLSVDIMKPKYILKKELNDFYKTVSTIIDQSSLLLNRVFFFYKTDFITDTDGRAIHRDDPDKIFTKWELYLRAYTLHKQGYDFHQIYDKLHSDKAVEDGYFTTNLYVNSAKKLIRSAEQETFPYTIADLTNEPAK